MDVDLRNTASGQVVVNTTTPVTVLLDPFRVYELCLPDTVGGLVHYGVNGTAPVANANETATDRGWLGTSGFDSPPPVHITGCDRMALQATSADTTVVFRMVASRSRVRG